jgi:hypothetical protein
MDLVKIMIRKRYRSVCGRHCFDFTEHTTVTGTFGSDRLSVCFMAQREPVLAAVLGAHESVI